MTPMQMLTTEKTPQNLKQSQESVSSVRPLRLGFDMNWQQGQEPPSLYKDFVQPVSSPSVKAYLEQIHDSSPFNILENSTPAKRVNKEEALDTSVQSEDVLDTIDVEKRHGVNEPQNTTHSTA